MYAGELCYWYLTFKNETIFTASPASPSASPQPDPTTSPDSPGSAKLDPEKLEKIQARKKVEARRKKTRQQPPPPPPPTDKTLSMDDLLLPGFQQRAEAAAELEVPFDAWTVGSTMLARYADAAQVVTWWSTDQALHLLNFFGLLQTSGTSGAGQPAPMLVEGATEQPLEG